jgi:hypothetical protein
MSLIPQLPYLLQDFLLPLVVFHTPANDLFPEWQMPLWADVLSTISDRDVVLLMMLKNGTDSTANVRRNFIR